MRVSFVSFVFLVITHCYYGHENNVCKNWHDYWTYKTNKNCRYNPEVDQTIPEIITDRGYPLETHELLSEDGYYTTTFRLPNLGHPVYLFHGISSSGKVFLTNGNQSLAFLLHDLGYDVWIGNHRGNGYGTKNIKLSPKNPKFWNFDAYEMAKYDLRKTLTYIKETTRRKVRMISYSIGTTISMTYQALYGEEARENVEINVMMAAAVNNKYTKAVPLKVLGVYGDTVWALVRFFRLEYYLSDYKVQEFLSAISRSPYLIRASLKMLDQSAGTRNYQITPEMAPVLYGCSTLQGNSLKLLINGAQNWLHGFGRFYYGPLENRLVYGTVTNPKYNISLNRVPVFIFCAIDDFIGDPKDSKRLYEDLPEDTRVGIHEIKVKGFNHLGYTNGKDVKVIVYDKIIEIFSSLA